MSLALVRNSLYKFLNDNLDTFITYDSGQSDLSDITNIRVSASIPVGTLSFGLVDTFGNPYVTDKDIIGGYLTYNGESSLITNWSNITSIITIQTGFSNIIDVGEILSIADTSLIYMRIPNSMANSKTRLHSLQEKSRFDLFIKTKNDNDKSNIYSILQNIRNLIIGSRGNFIIYDTDLITKLGYGKIEIPYNEDDMIDTPNDQQSFLVSFRVSYWVKYI